MRKSKQSTNYVQTSIFNSMNNLKALSQTQKKRKDYLSSIVIEVHSSDSEADTNFSIMEKLAAKRRLPFPLSDDEDSNGVLRKG